MGLEHRLACIECAEFIELHKWSTDCMQDFPFLGRDEYKKYSVCHTDRKLILQGISEAENGILKQTPEHWVGKLIPDVRGFLELHGDHTLYIFDDRGDMPWYSDEPEWHRWKEIRGYMTTWNDQFEDVELPRNLIDDMNIISWNEALVHYKNNCPFTDNPEKLESVFRLYIKQNV